MEIEEEIGKGIQKIEKSIYNRTGSGNTRSGQGDTSRSRCVRLCNRGSAVNKV